MLLQWNLPQWLTRLFRGWTTETRRRKCVSLTSHTPVTNALCSGNAALSYGGLLLLTRFNEVDTDIKDKDDYPLLFRSFQTMSFQNSWKQGLKQEHADMGSQPLITTLKRRTRPGCTSIHSHTDKETVVHPDRECSHWEFQHMTPGGWTSEPACQVKEARLKMSPASFTWNMHNR